MASVIEPPCFGPVAAPAGPAIPLSDPAMSATPSAPVSDRRPVPMMSPLTGRIVGLRTGGARSAHPAGVGELAVDRVGGADEGEMGEGLGEVAGARREV